MATRLDVVKEESLYINPEAQVSIFKGTISQGRLKVAIKEQVHSSPYSANFAIREALSHAQLTHEHICVMYDCYLTQTGSGDLKTVIVTELLESDLDKEIRTRKASNNYWTETELLAFLEQVTSALAFAQGKGISHRDIKPQNIFVTNDMLKIGDFGSSARNVDLEEFAKTVQGSPLFLSPELKRGYMKQMNDRSYKMEPYDPFASDVYSLGVTFLYLARLEPPMELTKLEQLQTAAERVVQELGMPRLGQILLHMLQEVPSNRKSFEFLHQELESFGALSSPYFPQQESDPLNPPERQSAALEERKTINVLDVGQSGLGRKGCSTCLEPIVDFTWQSSLPAK